MVKLKPRTLSLNNVVSFTVDLDEGDTTLEVVDAAGDEFRRVLVGNGYYTTGPVVFRALPDSRSFTLMTTLGNRVNVVGDTGSGFEFHERVEVETDYFYRHCDSEEPVPYAELEQAVAQAGSRIRDIFHVILDVYGDVVLDLYLDVEKR